MDITFKNRDFSEKADQPQGVEVVRFDWNQVGGPWTATLKMPAGADKWEVHKLLRCPVEIYGRDKSKPLWWGYVNRVTVPQGDLRFGYGLDNMFNHVTVRYGDGLTESDSDSISIAEWGQKEEIISAYASTGLEASQKRNVELANRSTPVAENEFTGGEVDVEIYCQGWYWTLGWMNYTNTAEANVSNTTQIQTIATATGQFLNGVLIENSAGVTSNETRDHRDGLSCVTELLQAGTSNYRPLLAWVDRNRYLHVYERSANPPQGDIDYVMRDDGSLEEVAGGAPVPDELCTVAKWVRAKGSPVEFSFFIESAEYKAETDKTTYRPAGAYEQQRLAKYIRNVITGEQGPHLWPGLIVPPTNEFVPYWVALGKDGDDITDVNALVYDEDNNLLYVGGDFAVIGGVEASNVAVLDMATGQWSALGDGLAGPCYALAWDGTSGILYAASDDSGDGYIQQWNGSAWSGLDTGVSGTIYALALDGTDLYATGDNSAVEKWNGSSWSTIGTLATSGGAFSGTGLSLAVGDGILAVGGDFDTIGGVSADYIAYWDGVNFHPCGSGTTAQVYCLAFNKDLTALYAGGIFTEAGGVGYTNRFGKWIVASDTWEAVAQEGLPTATGPVVYGVAVDQNDLVYVLGYGILPGGVDLNNCAVWDGGEWRALGSGLSGNSEYPDIPTYENRGAVAIFSGLFPIMGWDFTHAGGNPALGIAMYITTLDGMIDYLNTTGSVARPGGPDQAIQSNQGGRFWGSKYWLFDKTNHNIIFGGLTPPIAGSFAYHHILQDQSPGHGLWVFSNSDYAAFVTGWRARGTVSSAAALQEGDVMLRLRGRGYNGSGWGSGSKATIQAVCAENWNTSSNGALWEVWTTPKGSATPEKKFILSSEGLDLLEQASDPSTAGSGRWKLYAKPGGLYLLDDAANVIGPLGAGISTFQFGFFPYQDSMPFTGTANPGILTVGAAFDISSFVCGTYVTTTNDSSNYWTLTVKRLSDNSTIATFDTSGDSADTWTRHADSSPSITSLGLSDVGAYLRVEIGLGSPGNLYISSPLFLGLFQ